jgi:hypothetical protein
MNERAYELENSRTYQILNSGAYELIALSDYPEVLFMAPPGQLHKIAYVYHSRLGYTCFDTK